MKQSKHFSRFNFKDRISPKQFKEFESRYETFAEIPTVSAGFFANDEEHKVSAVHIVKSQKNVRHQMTRKLLETYTETANGWQRVPWLWDVGSTAIYPSPSRRKLAKITKITASSKGKGTSSGDKVSVIEIYDDQQLIDTVYPPAGSFGDIYKSIPFEGVSWNKEEDLIAFIAERAAPKTTSFFNEKTQIQRHKVTAPNGDGGAEDDDSAKDAVFGHKFDFKESFGEQADGASSTTLFLYDLTTKKLFDFDDDDGGGLFPDDVVLSECQFDPNDSSTLCLVSLSTTPRRMGTRFYNSRPSKLWRLRLPSSIAAQSELSSPALTRLAVTDCSPQNVRFSPSGQKLVYFSTENTFSHLAPVRLRTMKWPPSMAEEQKGGDDGDGGVETVIDIPSGSEVTARAVIEEGAFPGIWCYGGVPSRCWLDEHRMVINSLCGHVWGSLLIDFRHKSAVKMHEFAEIEDHFKGSIPTEIARNFMVLDMDRGSGNVLFMTSSIQRGHTVDIFNVGTKTVSPLTTTIDPLRHRGDARKLIEAISSIETKLFRHEVPRDDDDDGDGDHN